MAENDFSKIDNKEVAPNKSKNSGFNSILMIIVSVLLALNLTVTLIMFVGFIQTKNRIEAEYEKIQNSINTFTQDIDEQVFGQIDDIVEGLKSELEGQVEGLTEEMANKIEDVKETFAKYEEDIKKITSSLNNLDEGTETINKALESVQEILDGIKGMFGIR